jgi:hypothetical protein
MSYYLDPWLFNCVNNPADSIAEQAEQAVIREATTRAIRYALAHDVLPIVAAGNQGVDLNNPSVDWSSPDYPAGSVRERHLDSSCATLPTQTPGVVSVSATGPTSRLAAYSNYGEGQVDLSAPGGDFFDSVDNSYDVRNGVLAAYPRALAEAAGVDASGAPLSDNIVRSCVRATCGYYQYLQGTSMAAPHVAGVAALIVSRYGTIRGGSFGLSAATTRDRLLQSVTPHPCSKPRTFTWTLLLDPESDYSILQTATCEGPANHNGFFGAGTINAATAVSMPPH